TGGSTNLVSKGTTAKVISLAAEYGALTESINKQIVTVQGSLDGVPAALVRHHVVEYCPAGGASNCVDGGVLEALRRVSYAVSFDTSQSAQTVSGTPSASAAGAAQPVAFTADGHSITSAGVRFVLWNARDTVSKSYDEAWTKEIVKSHAALEGAATGLLNATIALVGAVEADPAYAPWQDETVQRLVAARPNRDEVVAVWTGRQHVLAQQLRRTHPAIFVKAADERSALSVYRLEEDAVAATLRKPVATLQYDYKRPASQPSTSTVRLIFDKGLGTGW